MFQSSIIPELKRIVANINKELNKSEARNVFILFDSWGPIVEEQVLDKAAEGSSAVNMSAAKFKNELANVLGAYGNTVLVLNHVYASLQQYGDAFAIPGGKKLYFLSDAIMMASSAAKAKDKEGNIYGKIITAQVKKGRAAKEFAKTHFLIEHSGGVNPYYGLLDDAIASECVFKPKPGYFPLPDYDLSNRQQVKVCVYGKVLDENYSQILFANPDFDLETVFLIDCVQKRIKIDKEAVKHLRKLKVIEGKSPNIFLSASVSETIGEQSQYVKNKAFNDQYYRDLIVKYLEQYGSAKKRDVRELLWDKLPEVMDDKQKESKVKNLLAQMRRMGIITTDSENQQKSSWILVKDLNK